ncbi:MAG TPA: ATP-binding protein, partial [Acidimicrobiales bacterium]|nr:ATP-binding protein [Acidimicrobiales bacterium]
LSEARVEDLLADLLVLASIDERTPAPSDLVDLRAVADEEASADRPVTVTVTVDGGRLVVDDDGPGIPPGDRERVFERFTRLDEARTRDDGGAGLGLSLVRAVVRAHEGRVWIEASPAGGTRVIVELPAGTEEDGPTT